MFMNDKKILRLDYLKLGLMMHSVGESQITPLDPTEEHRLRTRCWVAVARPKHKRCLYSTGDLAHSYKLEMIASCSICKDLTVALKIQQRLID